MGMRQQKRPTKWSASDADRLKPGLRTPQKGELQTGYTPALAFSNSLRSSGKSWAFADHPRYYLALGALPFAFKMRP